MDASPFAAFCQKRSRDEDDVEARPKRAKAFATVTSACDRALDGAMQDSMGFAGDDDGMDLDDMDTDSASCDEDDITSDPRPHLAQPEWPLVVPRMLHQLSTTSLSSLASTSSTGGPSTPSDLSHSFHSFPDPAATPTPASAFPSCSNPQSFTDMNGITRTFFPSNALSVYPSSSPPKTPFLDNASAFAQYAYSHGFNGGARAEGTIEVQQPGGSGFGHEGLRQLEMPKYGWDVPAQGLCMGGHLV